MKKAIIIALTVILGIFLSGTLLAEAFPKTIVPADASWMLHLDLDRLLSSSLFNKIVGEDGWDKIKQRNDRISKKFRINLLEDVNGITVYGKGRKEENAVACISGNFDKDHLLSLLSLDDDHQEISHGSYTVHHWGHDEYGAFVGNDLAVLSQSEDALKHALDVIAGKAKNVSQTDAAGPITQSPADVFLWAFVRNISDLTAGVKGPALFKKAETALFHMSERGENIQVQAEMAVSTPEDADNIEQILKGLLAMGDMYKDEIPAGIQIPQDIRIGRSGNSVRVDISYPSAYLVKLFAKRGRFPLHLARQILHPLFP